MQGPFDPTITRPITFQFRETGNRLASPKGIIFENDKTDQANWEVLDNRAFHPIGFITTLYGEWDKIKANIAEHLLLDAQSTKLDSLENLLNNGCENIRIHHVFNREKTNQLEFQVAFQYGQMPETSITIQVPVEKFHQHYIDYQHLVRTHYQLRAYEKTQPIYFEAERFNEALVGALPDNYQLNHYPLRNTVCKNAKVPQFLKNVWKAIDDDVFMPQGFKFHVLMDMFDTLIASKYMTPDEKSEAEALLSSMQPDIRVYLKENYYDAPIRYKEDSCADLLKKLNAVRPWRAMVRVTDVEKESLYQFFDKILNTQTSTTITYLLARAYMRACYASASNEVKASAPKIGNVLDDFEAALIDKTKSLKVITAVHERYKGKWYFEDKAKSSVAAMGYSLPAMASVLNYYVDDLLLTRHTLGQHARDYQADSFHVKSIRKIDRGSKGACDFEFDIQLSNSPLERPYTLKVQGARLEHDVLHPEALKVIEKDSKRTLKELLTLRVEIVNEVLGGDATVAMQAKVGALLGVDYQRLWEASPQANQLRKHLNASLQLPSVKLSAYEQGKLLMNSLIALALRLEGQNSNEDSIVLALLEAFIQKEMFSKQDLYNAIKNPVDGFVFEDGVRRKAKLVNKLVDRSIFSEDMLGLQDYADIQTQFDISDMVIQEESNPDTRELLKKNQAKGLLINSKFNKEIASEQTDLTAKIALNLAATYEAPESDVVTQGVEDLSQALASMSSSKLLAHGMLLRGLLASGVYQPARPTSFPGRDKLSLLSAAEAIYAKAKADAHRKNTGLVCSGSQLLRGEESLATQLDIAKSLCLCTEVSENYQRDFMVPVKEQPKKDDDDSAGSAAPSSKKGKKKSGRTVNVAALPVVRANQSRDGSPSPAAEGEASGRNNTVLEALREATHNYMQENADLLKKMQGLQQMPVFLECDNLNTDLTNAIKEAESWLTANAFLELKARLVSLKAYQDQFNDELADKKGLIIREVTKVEYQFKQIDDPAISLAQTARVAIGNLRDYEASLATDLSTRMQNLQRLTGQLRGELQAAQTKLDDAKRTNKQALADRDNLIADSQAALTQAITRVETAIQNKLPIDFLPATCARILAYGQYTEDKPLPKMTQDIGTVLQGLEKLRAALGVVQGNTPTPLNPEQAHGAVTQELCEAKTARKKLTWLNPFNWSKIRDANNRIASLKQEADFFAKLFYFNKSKKPEEKLAALSKDGLEKTLKEWIRKAEKSWFSRKKYGKQAVWAAKQLANLRQIACAHALDGQNGTGPFLSELQRFEQLLKQEGEVFKYVKSLLPEAFTEFQEDLVVAELPLESLNLERDGIAATLFKGIEESKILQSSVGRTLVRTSFTGRRDGEAAPALETSPRQTLVAVI